MTKAEERDGAGIEGVSKKRDQWRCRGEEGGERNMKSAEKVRKGEWEQFVGNIPGTKIPKSVEKDVIVICRLGIVHFSFFL